METLGTDESTGYRNTLITVENVLLSNLVPWAQDWGILSQNEENGDSRAPKETHVWQPLWVTLASTCLHITSFRQMTGHCVAKQQARNWFQISSFI